MAVPVGPARPAARNPGSQSALRQQNEQRVLETLLANGPATQAELARSTGLSSATISNLVRVLTDSGVVRTCPTTSSGRRAVSVSLNSRGAVSVGIDIGRRHVRVVLASLGYQVIAEDVVALPAGHQASATLDVAADLLARLLKDDGVARRSIVGVGVGIPGPIDRRTGTVAQGAILPEWVGVNLREDVAARLELPVHVDNDANLGALAQITWGGYAGVEHLMFLKVATGIGAGLIVNGALYYGAVGITGEIGHATISEHGILCRCGNRGCLETVASTSVMLDALSRGSSTPITTEDIVRRAHQGDLATLRVVDDAGSAIGRVVAHAANLINPEVIVVGGPLVGLGDILLDPIRRGMLRYSVPVVGETTELAMSSFADRAEALGGAALVFQHARLARPTNGHS